MAEDLDRWLDGEPITARPVTARERAIKWVRRKPAIAALSAAVFLVAVLGISGVIWQWRRAVANAELASIREGEVSKANNSLKESLKKARFNSYVSHIHLAQREWENAHVYRARELLNDSTENEFHGFEWYYLNHLFHPEILTLKGHTLGVSVSFSQDGLRVASASEDGTVKIWDASTGQELLALKGHTGWVSGVSFSPDGLRVASAGFDGTVKIWDASTGQELLALKGHAGGVSGVSFSPDGHRIASSGEDGTIKIWDATDRP